MAGILPHGFDLGKGPETPSHLRDFTNRGGFGARSGGRPVDRKDQSAVDLTYGVAVVVEQAPQAGCRVAAVDPAELLGELALEGGREELMGNEEVRKAYIGV